MPSSSCTMKSRPPGTSGSRVCSLALRESCHRWSEHNHSAGPPDNDVATVGHWSCFVDWYQICLDRFFLYEIWQILDLWNDLKWMSSASLWNWKPTGNDHNWSSKQKEASTQSKLRAHRIWQRTGKNCGKSWRGWATSELSSQGVHNSKGFHRTVCKEVLNIS